MNHDELSDIAEQTRQSEESYEHVVRVCVSAGCLSANSEQVKAQLESEVKQRGLASCCKVKGVGCLGLCAAGPLVAADGNQKMFQSVTPADAGAILDSVVEGKPAPTALMLDGKQDFFAKQKKLVLENCGEIDPERIEDYIASEGYEALLHVLSQMKPQQVIEQITRSGLRGRGGAGFPTGLKWTTVHKAAGARKFVVCNADEGDPGAFMDRSVLESDPHRVLEGMAIAGYAVGASRGYIYCRAEYPLAIKRLRLAVRQAENNGLLGMNIGDTHFDFKIEVRLGAGAFVCGEETALIASIEGGRGTPKPRPPFPAQQGLWEAPTLINNVETFANVPPIIRRSGDWFASIGTEKSKGTKVFALSGRVKNTGLIEVPMGMTLREIIFDLGGGVPDGRRFKAVQSGGPSGGCVPEQHLDTPLDYESLVSLGSIMGSGGMIVMDESSCMVDVARFFMDFCMSESCGKCVPCRVGTTQMYNILERITHGRAGAHDLELLQKLAAMVKAASLCGLGQTAPNPTLTTLRYFMDEYRAHLEEGRCPAGVCRLRARESSEVGAEEVQR
jgi:bidirectional [NiFe] hydrogenase diaphorase subunit